MTGHDEPDTLERDVDDVLRAAMIPLEALPAIFGVTRMTVHRWLARDGIPKHRYAGGKAVKWGDILDASHRAPTRWQLPADSTGVTRKP